MKSVGRNVIPSCKKSVTRQQNRCLWQVSAVNATISAPTRPCAHRWGEIERNAKLESTSVCIPSPNLIPTTYSITMKTALIVVALVACVGLASAACPNACSGHGTCGPKDECNCYPNWQASDCSERTCPFGLGFVDTPQGDLNHDGSITDTTVAVQWNVMNTWERFPNVAGSDYVARSNEGHFYVECSNKGFCDRTSGLCECFEGYEGSSCQRTTCPNDCSGHGICRTVDEIAAGALNKKLVNREHDYELWSGVETAFTYNLWDGDKNQACVCDYGYSGFDCSLRECPRGDDPMTHRAKDCAGYACTNERQLLNIDMSDASTDESMYFSLNFTDWAGQTWVTNQIQIGKPGQDASSTTFQSHSGAFDKVIVSAATAATVLEAELEGIPNGVFENVKVEAAIDATNTDLYLVTFTFFDNSGALPLLVAYVHEGTEPATPSGLTLADITITRDRAGNKEEATCSNRGICDYETGICKCFRGYYDDDCSVQHALAL